MWKDNTGRIYFDFTQYSFTAYLFILINVHDLIDIM